jgi:molybdopterin-guanine dinucleotide biosynthesis protein A
MTPGITGFVMAGGKSSRMGTDKASLSLNGKTLLEHALTTVRQVAKEVFILGSHQLYGDYGAEVIEDIFPGCGPLGGIHAALSHVKQMIQLIRLESQPPQLQPLPPSATLSLVLAVDTPFITAEFLSYLAEQAVNSGAVVTTPEIDAYPQPLCSVYSLDFLPIAEQALKAGNYKIVPLFPKDKTLVIKESEVRRFAFPADMFENLNTPEDLERARRRSSRTDL